jgi:hypothetical protein
VKSLFENITGDRMLVGEQRYVFAKFNVGSTFYFDVKRTRRGWAWVAWPGPGASSSGAEPSRLRAMLAAARATLALESEAALSAPGGDIPF